MTTRLHLKSSPKNRKDSLVRYGAIESRHALATAPQSECAPYPRLRVTCFVLFCSRESKYEIRVLRVVACVRKFLYTVTQKTRVYKLKLAKMAKKTVKIRPGATVRPYGLDQKKSAKIVDLRFVLQEKNRFSVKTWQIGIFLR